MCIYPSLSDSSFTILSFSAVSKPPAHGVRPAGRSLPTSTAGSHVPLKLLQPLFVHLKYIILISLDFHTTSTAHAE